jgi:aspartate-semialdehyde dehydrogenase
MSITSLRLAIVGVTGAVGKELLKVLETRGFPLRELRCFASPRSSGKQVLFRGDSLPINSLSEKAFQGVDIAIFSAGSKVSKQWMPIAVKQGVKVIDNSSAFRMDPDVPLIIPEINSHALKPHHLLIASPNCSATILLMAIAPLHRRFKILRVLTTTYQAASGAGMRAMQELEEESLAYLEKRPYVRTVMPHPYAFNLFPHNSPLNEEGYADEEVKIVQESHKILEDDQIAIHATCIRVPVLRAHSEAVNITFSQPVDVDQAYAVLRETTGLCVLEDRALNRFPMPSDANGQDPIFCGRLRKDPSFPNTLDLWIVGDQLLKGAALNAVQIAELLTRQPSCASFAS